MTEYIDTRQLRAFLALARTGSFTGAARTLNLTQSAVSHGIKSLEDTIGNQLVHRTVKPLTLTPHGQELLRHAETMEQCMRQAFAGLRALNGPAPKTLRVGCALAASRYILPEVLQAFKTRHPDCEVEVLPDQCAGVLGMILHHRVDLGILIQSPESQGIGAHPLFTDELVFTAAAGHPSTRKKEPLRSHTLIIASRESFTHQFVTGRLQQHNVLPQSIMELGTGEAVRELTLTGYGIGVCARWLVESELQKGTLIALPAPGGPLHRNWIAATLHGRVLNPMEQEFITLSRQHAPQFAPAAS